MWISDTSIKRPVFATMFILSFVVLGIVSMTRLGIDLFPAVDFPFVNISTVYPGASPEEVETLVTKPIEDAVAGIEGVKRVESNSSEGFSRVGIEFKLGLDPQGSAAEVGRKSPRFYSGFRRRSKTRRSRASTLRRCRSRPTRCPLPCPPTRRVSWSKTR